MGNNPTTIGSWTDCRAGDVRTAEGKLFGHLGMSGAAIIERLKLDEEYAKRVAECMIMDGYSDLPHYASMRDAFEDRFFGLSEWKQHFGADIHAWYKDVPPIPWFRQDLSKECPFVPGKNIYETHMLYLIPSKVIVSRQEIELDIEGWTRILQGSQHPRFTVDFSKLSEEDKEDFLGRGSYDGIDTTIMMNWVCAPIFTVPGSHNRTLSEQKRMLPPGYGTPLCIEVPTKFILWVKAHKEMMYPDTMMGRCGADTLLDIGYGENGIVVAKRREPNERFVDLAVHASLNPPDAVIGEYAPYS